MTEKELFEQYEQAQKREAELVSAFMSSTEVLDELAALCHLMRHRGRMDALLEMMSAVSVTRHQQEAGEVQS